MNFKDLFNNKKIKVLENKIKDLNVDIKKQKTSFKFSHSARIKLDRRIKAGESYLLKSKNKDSKKIIKILNGEN